MLFTVTGSILGSRAAVRVDTMEARQVGSSGLRVRLARRFHNDATREVRRVRDKRSVRAFRLAGHAHLPEPVEFDDDLPPALGR